MKRNQNSSPPYRYIRRVADQVSWLRPITLLLFLAAVIPFTTAYSKETQQPTNSESQILTSEQAIEGLRQLLNKTPEQNIPFSDFVMLAHALDEKSLIPLLDEVTRRRSNGYRRWTLSALYAELASRDLDAALDHHRKNYAGYGRIREEIPHALYVGSRPEDPWAALAYLKNLPNDPRFHYSEKESGINAPMFYMHEDWLKVSYKRLFKKLASIDPERAWRELPGRANGNEEPLNHNKLAYEFYPYPGMVDGFFSGLKDYKTFQKYLKRFGPVRQPGNELIAIPIAKAWMTHDIAAAQAWAPPERSNDSLYGVLINGVDGNAAINWARKNPKAALEAIRDDVLPKWTGTLAQALLQSDPSLASDLVAILSDYRRPPSTRSRDYWMNSDGEWIPDEETTGENESPIVVPPKKDTPPYIWNILHSSMRENAELQDRDAFPEPGHPNRPLDYRARYDSYRAAIAGEVFSKEEQTKLQSYLDETFGTILNLPNHK